MRVVSFNIHHGTVGRRGPVDPERLGLVCAGLEADVLCLQEVDQGTWRVRGVDLAAVVAEACGMRHAFGAARWFPGGRYGNALLVRGELGDVEVLPLPLVPWWGIWHEPRVALVADVVVDGRQVRVACTHLSVPRRQNGPQLEALLDGLGGGARPTLVVGDLNRRTADVASIVEGRGMQLVEHAPTFPAWRPDQDIDHVIATPHFDLARGQVHRTPMSDHAALVVDVQIRA